MKITTEIASKVLEIVDTGLVKGVGKPIPGKMCVEAAVCYALGEPHGDNPSCVSPVVRSLKITLNDFEWSSNQARAKGLRRLAIAQLGTNGVLDDKEFANRASEIAIRKAVPYALWCAAEVHKNAAHKPALLDAAQRCEREGTTAVAAAAAWAAAWEAAEAAAWEAWEAAARATAEAAAARAAVAAALAARAAAEAAAAAAEAAEERDRILSLFAEEIVQVLIELKAPGCEWLYLTEGVQE